jgi:acetylornithine deacetylase/succinyl-diaminopimelate desuccinylase-like protein
MNPIDYDKYTKDCAAFLQKLIQTPSVNGKDDEKAVAALIVQEAEKLGLPTRVIEDEPGRPNVFVGEGFESADNLLLVAHCDTVPVGDESKWQYSPFSGEIVEDKLYGRGAIDCKGGLAISLYTLKILKDRGQGHLAKFLSGVDEESGADSQFGIRAALRQGLKAKAAVYTYGGAQKNELTIGHRGLIRLWVTCHGETAHSGSREWQDGTKGESAISGIMSLLDELKKVSTENNNDFFPGYKTVITPTMIKGGEGESLVPGQAEVLLDIRTLPGDNERLMAQIEEITKKLSSDKRTYSICVKNNIPAVVTDSESAIVQEAIKLKTKIYGFQNLALKGSGPANESYMLVEAGIPTIVGFGPRGEGFHSANEYAEVSSIKQSLEFLVSLSRQLRP